MDLRNRNVSGKNPNLQSHQKQQNDDKDWKTCHYRELPKWLQDNDYLLQEHRPPLSSYRLCFGSIFRLHTETGNILTHLIGFVLFVVIAETLYIRNMYHPIDALMLGKDD